MKVIPVRNPNLVKRYLSAKKVKLEISEMATPLVVGITERAHLNFKKHLFISIEVDSQVAFSSNPYNIFHVEDSRVYIHANLEELGILHILNLYSKQMLNENFKLKSEYKVLEEKSFVQFVKFPLFDENEWVRYVLSRMHDEFMWLNKPFKITKNAIRVITGLYSFGDIPKLKSMKNQIVTDTTSSKFDRRAMTINDILEHDVRFSSMMTRYKIYSSSRENSVSSTAIYATYEMVKEKKKYDLCELLQSEPMKNLSKIKKDKKNTFEYGTLILCLFF